MSIGSPFTLVISTRRRRIPEITNTVERMLELEKEEEFLEGIAYNGIEFCKLSTKSEKITVNCPKKQNSEISRTRCAVGPIFRAYVYRGSLEKNI